MERTRLTDGAQLALHTFLHSIEGREVKALMATKAPTMVIDHESNKPTEIAALTGAKHKGWEDCWTTLEDISDPEYGENSNLK
jgi:hypothetical protein